MSTIPQEFNWTKARAECSAEKLFKNLQIGIENDIASINANKFSAPVPYLDEGFGSSLTADGRGFIVAHRSRTGPRVVFFVQGNAIEVRDEASQRNYVASVILNREGRCKLQIDGEEYELWQVRKLALETLFFGSTLPPKDPGGAQ